MLAVIGVGLLALVVAGVVYLRLERLRLAGLGMTVLRTVGVTALALLLFSFAVLAITYALQRQFIRAWPIR